MWFFEHNPHLSDEGKLSVLNVSVGQLTCHCWSCILPPCSSFGEICCLHLLGWSE